MRVFLHFELADLVDAAGLTEGLPDQPIQNGENSHGWLLYNTT